MSKPAVIPANYTHAEFKPGLKVCRIVLEIPQEKRKEFFDAFGYPDPANPVPVCLARLDRNIAKEIETGLREIAADIAEPLTTGPQGPATQNGPDGTSSAPLPPHAEPAKDQDRPRTYTKSQVAHLKCTDPAFREWIFEAHKEFQDWDIRLVRKKEPDATDENLAGRALKAILNITSKKELDVPGPAAEAFDKLLTDYDMKAYTR